MRRHSSKFIRTSQLVWERKNRLNRFSLFWIVAKYQPMSQYNICNSSNTRSRTLPDKIQDSLLQNTCNLVLRKALGQDPISGILLPTDENIGSRMKTCLSIIDSYDEFMDFIFPPNISFFMMNFELVLGTCFFHS